MFERIMGIVTFQAPIYRAIVHDRAALKQAALIVIVISLIQDGCGALLRTATGGIPINGVNAISLAALNVILGLIVWIVTAGLITLIAKTLGGQTDMGEMLRMTGFVQVFGALTILNLAVLIGPALAFVTPLIVLAYFGASLVAYFVGVRQAVEFSAGKAMVTAILALIVNAGVAVLVDRASNAALLGIWPVAS